MRLDGNMKISVNIGGDMSVNELYDGQFGNYIKVREADYYHGPYEVTPSRDAQTLEVTDYTMTQNITISPIPNNYGLITYNGSTITVS